MFTNPDNPLSICCFAVRRNKYKKVSTGEVFRKDSRLFVGSRKSQLNFHGVPPSCQTFRILESVKKKRKKRK